MILIPIVDKAVRIVDVCPKCKTSSLKLFYTSDGMPFIGCPNCDYKRELVLFKYCPKCKGKMKYVFKHDKFKCENCGSWFKVVLEEDKPKSEPKEKDLLESLLNSDLFRKKVEEIVCELVLVKLRTQIYANVRDEILKRL